MYVSPFSCHYVIYIYNQAVILEAVLQITSPSMKMIYQAALLHCSICDEILYALQFWY